MLILLGTHGHTRMGVQSALEYPRPSPKSRSLELVDHESRDERLFSPRLVPAGWARVARPEVGLEDDRARGECHRAELRHPLGRLPERHPRVVEPGSHEHRRVCGPMHVVIWRIALHVLVELRVVGVAPLLVLIDGEWYRFVEHRRERVDKRNLRYCAGEKVGP